MLIGMWRRSPSGDAFSEHQSRHARAHDGTGKRITAVGHGEARFIASNQTATGRQKNRRIEISYKRE